MDLYFITDIGINRPGQFTDDHAADCEGSSKEMVGAITFCNEPDDENTDNLFNELAGSRHKGLFQAQIVAVQAASDGSKGKNRCHQF